LNEIENLRVVFLKDLQEEMKDFNESVGKYFEKETKNGAEKNDKKDDDVMKKYYEILGIKNVNVNLVEIKKAYRQKAMKWHPDKNNNSEESCIKFNEIKEAYDTILKNK
jgi:preprotein translocase subunit Sec63